MLQCEWVVVVICKIEVDFNWLVDIYLILMDLFGYVGIDLYFKDEFSYFIGSLKYWLVCLLFLYVLINGWLCEGCLVIEVFSGFIVVFEVYFVCLLGLFFIVVILVMILLEKIVVIEFQGGSCYLVECVCDLNCDLEKFVCDIGGYFMDQFIYVECVIDWCVNNNIVEFIFKQMVEELYLVLEWIVCSFGMGGIVVMLGCYVSYCCYDICIFCVDLEVLVFYDGYCVVLVGQLWCELICSGGLWVEGIGWLWVEFSFILISVDVMVKVFDVLSLVVMWYVSWQLGCCVGGLIGINFIGVLQVVEWMCQVGCSGLIVIILCDSGECYVYSYYNFEWYLCQGIEVDQFDVWVVVVVNGQGLVFLLYVVLEMLY